MEKVFISYGSKNRHLAEALCAHLEGRGIPCWMAPRDISSGTYAGEITRAIKAADVMIAIFSKNSHSEHVKNEVNVAFNNAKLILPYCLDDNPFDDDLEYWLSSKQRLVSCGDKEKDFDRIEHIIREHRGEAAAVPPAAPAAKPRKRSLLLPLLILAALLAVALFFYLRQDRESEEASVESSEQPLDSLTRELPVIQEPKEKAPSVSAINPVVQPEKRPVPATAETIDPDANTFTGAIKNGFPDGFGTFTFKKARTIRMPDGKERTFNAGDYIKGTWENGHFSSGELYCSDGRKVEYLLPIDYHHTDKDRLDWKCVKP